MALEARLHLRSDRSVELRITWLAPTSSAAAIGSGCAEDGAGHEVPRHEYAKLLARACAMRTASPAIARRPTRWVGWNCGERCESESICEFPLPWA